MVPGNLRKAIKLHVEAYHDREERDRVWLLQTVDSLCRPYVVDYGIA